MAEQTWWRPLIVPTWRIIEREHDVPAVPSVFWWLNYISPSDVSREDFERIARTIQWMTQKDIELIMRAYYDVKTAMEYKKLHRTTWEKSFYHPKGLALIAMLELWEKKSSVIATDLLHDDEEDTYHRIGLIRWSFWDEIANACQLLTNRPEMENYDFKNMYPSEYERIMDTHFKLIAMDEIASCVKTHDTIHNFRTLPEIEYNRGEDEVSRLILKYQKKLDKAQRYIFPIATKLAETRDPRYTLSLGLSVQMVRRKIEEAQKFLQNNH